MWVVAVLFPISRDPPEGGTQNFSHNKPPLSLKFPISRDPPEGGTCSEFAPSLLGVGVEFPISRDPPEGGTH